MSIEKEAIEGDTTTPPATLSEKLRQCNETVLSERLAHDQERKGIEQERQAHAASELELRQVVTSLRWWAVFDLLWMLREMLEPARFAWGYPSSWAYKIASTSAHPWIVVCWFFTAALCIVPLIVTLAFTPNSRWSRRCEGIGCAGLFMGGIGFAVLSAFAARLDAAHIVESYRGSAMMLIGTGLLVACWHNSRMIRAHKTEPRKREDVCGRARA